MEEGEWDDLVSLCDLTEKNAAIDSDVEVEYEQVVVEINLFLVYFVVYFIKTRTNRP